MKPIIVNAAQRALLTDLTEPVEIHDETGRLIGMFVPIDCCENEKKTTLIPFTDEEIEKFKQSGDGCSLAEFWQRMGV